jgi:hypothetical protein
MEEIEEDSLVGLQAVTFSALITYSLFRSLPLVANGMYLSPDK